MVPAENAKSLLRELSTSFVPREGLATAMHVWRYLGRPLSLVGRVAFTGSATFNVSLGKLTP
jgi:hypothetical protein